MKKLFRLITLVTLVALLVTACSSSGGGGGAAQLKTGATKTQTISVAMPADPTKPVDMLIRLAAAEVVTNPGAGQLVDGTVQYNVPEFQPSISASGNKADITQGPTEGFKGTLPQDLINKWNLLFNMAVPINLTVQAGAYNGTWNLGGVRLQTIKWDEGASKSTITFDWPNPGKADTFNFTTAASTVKMTNLANLNFAKMTFNGGVGTYTLDFGGKLKQNASVDVKTGASNVTIVVPVGTSARITLKAAVSNIKTSGSWAVSGLVYATGKEDAAEKLTVNVEMGAGQLTLDTH